MLRPLHSRAKMQLDDEPEYLDTVVAFPTDATVGGLPADRENIDKERYLRVCGKD